MFVFEYAVDNEDFFTAMMAMWIEISAGCPPNHCSIGRLKLSQR